MKVTFRPMPWLSVIVAIMLVILMSLGIWQYQRLQWKTELLAEVEVSVTAPPLTSLDDLERAIAAGEPVDFRRIEFTYVPVKGTPIYNVFRSQTGGIFWDEFVLIRDSQKFIFVLGNTIEDEQKSNEFKEISKKSLWDKFDTEYGYVREDHPMGLVESWVKSKPNRSTNRWFKFNQDGKWADGLDSTNVILSHYIELKTDATSAETLPIRRPTIRNNHRDYMLTWFSFAGLLIIFYLLLHKRAGRLSW